MNGMEGCSHPLTVQLHPLFSELQSCDSTTLLLVISKLKCVLWDQSENILQSSSAHQLSEPNMRALLWINDQIGELFKKPQTQLAATLCLKVLLEVEYGDTNSLIQCFQHSLEESVQSADTTVAAKAAEVWGLLLKSSSRVGGTIGQHRLAFCIKDLGCTGKIKNKVTACLFLRQLLEHTPSLVVPCLSTLASGLQTTLQSSEGPLPGSAAGVLCDVLVLMYSSMDAASVKEWQNTFLTVALSGLSSNVPMQQVAALQCFNAVMSSITGEAASHDSAAVLSSLSVKNVHKVWEFVDSCVVSETCIPELRCELLHSLTLLAVYDTEMFKKRSITRAVDAATVIFGSGSDQQLKRLMFLKMGELAARMPDQIEHFLSCTMLHIEEALLQRSIKAHCKEVVGCFATFAEVNARAVRPYLRRVLYPLLSGPPTVEFAKDIARICSAFPELRSTCFSKILEAAKLQLPRVDHPMTLHTGVPVIDVDSTLQCLSGLGSLDFSGYSTLPFLCETVVPYVSFPHDEVRRAAIDVCFRLVLSGCVGAHSRCRQTIEGVFIHDGREHIQLFNTVIKKLVNAAVADPESYIRLRTLKSFTEEFDFTLALHDFVRSLFLALHDKHQNRLAVVKLLGRISSRNPAHVYPMLRRIMVHCVTEMQYFEHNKKLEQAFSVLGAIVESAPGLVKPYVSSLLNICVAWLNKPSHDASVCAALLSCVGKLVRYAEGDDVLVSANIRPIVVRHVLDSSHPQKKAEALRALRDIVRTTKDVNVYEQHTELLPALLQALHGGFKESWPVRKDVLQLMGAIGAVDPIYVKEILRDTRVNKSNTEVSPACKYRVEVSTAQTVLQSVLHILSLPSLTEDQSVAAVQVIVDILSLNTVPSYLVAFYHSIISSILRQARLQVRRREKILLLFASIVTRIRDHIRSHLDEITVTVAPFISTADLPVLRQVLTLLKQLRHSLREEFRPYMSSILVPIMNLLEENMPSANKIVLEFFSSMGLLLEDHIHTVLPVVCNIIANPSLPVSCRRAAISTLVSFALRLPSMRLHASRCVHCLLRVLREFSAGGRKNDDLPVKEVLTALQTVAQCLGKDFKNFVPMVLPVVSDCCAETGTDCKEFYEAVQGAVNHQHNFDAQHCETLCARVSASPSVVTVPDVKTPTSVHPHDSFAPLRLVLRKRGESDQEWSRWLPGVAVNLLRSSSSSSHKCALPLAEIHEPFARQMLHSAFATCYMGMEKGARQEVADTLTKVLRDPGAPSEVMQELLNLSEYMERLQIRPSTRGKENAWYSSALALFDLPTLMECSEKCNLYSKALHYVEIEFFETIREYERNLLRGCPKPLSPDAWQNLLQLCERSIYFCNLLGQRESAYGVLLFIQQNFSFLTGEDDSELPKMMGAQLFDKLQWWSRSKSAYEARLQVEPSKVSNMMGLLKALDALGAYRYELDKWWEFSKKLGKKEAAELAPMGAHAAWILREWDDMEKIASMMPDEGYIGTTALFYKSVIATRKGHFRESERLRSLCFRLIDYRLSALVAESYDRAYDLFIGIQQLNELEELSLASRDPRKTTHWQQLWERRLSKMAYEGWVGTLTNHALLVSPSHEIDMWLRFVSLSRANGQESLSTEVLYELLGKTSIEKAINNETPPSPAIAMGALQHLYETNQKGLAIDLLEKYVKRTDSLPSFLQDKERANLAVCHAKLGEWLAHRRSSTRSAESLSTILLHLHHATDLDKTNGSIWRTLGRVHCEAIAETTSGTLTVDIEDHIVRAINSYLRSVSLSEELEDALGFLSLWFMYGSLPAVQTNMTLKSEIQDVNPTVWLKVTPQIIARISSPDAVVADSVFHLLALIAKKHPQALLYSLNVAHASYQRECLAENAERLKGSKRVLTRITESHQNGPAMVSDASLACHELVRCAVLWPELWIDELERAWYQWGKDKNAANVLQALTPLMKLLGKPETMAETHFVTEFGQMLEDACACVEKAASSRNEAFMEEAWDRFKFIVKRVDEQISGMSSLALQLVSPKLLQNGKSWSLVVPGQYKESGDYPRISSFKSTLKVLNSKQRPRRIFIDGTDGELYKFLLKGHEDLRLDERVMQLLGFVNTILEKHSVVKRRDCFIQLYSVTPLSDNAGLVGWVDHCDTLHQIIKECRVSSNNISLERDLMQSMCDDLHRLTVIQHVEPFEHALECSEGADLVRSLWVKAPSAEVWLERRTTYVCSLATMSMVGHILGLGDRHPSNLMIHAFSGRVVHIDFGDCFEAAQHRSVYPEKVPFRLTRMLVKAMEMGGIEGLFRHGCVTVMGVLREEGRSLLALLEAFVHDPLVSWWRDDSEVVGEGHPEVALAGTTYTAGSLRISSHDCGVGSLQTAQRSIQRRNGDTKAAIHNREAVLRQITKAQRVVSRIKEKLSGLEFPQSQQRKGSDGFTVEEQVARLIEEATSNENLCVQFPGWCPFW
ncbi:putative phosphatidylinositol 3 kinase [Trypanosoma vivax]|nr:putative phosphatidylinositol 3 kinase [Trypanosoma vivax]